MGLYKKKLKELFIFSLKKLQKELMKEEQKNKRNREEMEVSNVGLFFIHGLTFDTTTFSILCFVED